MSREEIIRKYVNPLGLIAEYPKDFPENEFKEKLEEVLENKPLEIGEKYLQDFIYDTLEKKKTCTLENVANIFTNWTKIIERDMNLKGYLRVKNPNEVKYIPMKKING